MAAPTTSPRKSSGTTAGGLRLASPRTLAGDRRTLLTGRPLERGRPAADPPGGAGNRRPRRREGARRPQPSDTAVGVDLAEYAAIVAREGDPAQAETLRGLAGAGPASGSGRSLDRSRRPPAPRAHRDLGSPRSGGRADPDDRQPDRPRQLRQGRGAGPAAPIEDPRREPLLPLAAEPPSRPADLAATSGRSATLPCRLPTPRQRDLPAPARPPASGSRGAPKPLAPRCAIWPKPRRLGRAGEERCSTPSAPTRPSSSSRAIRLANRGMAESGSPVRLPPSRPRGIATSTSAPSSSKCSTRSFAPASSATSRRPRKSPSSNDPNEHRGQPDRPRPRTQPAASARAKLTATKTNPPMPKVRRPTAPRPVGAAPSPLQPGWSIR